MRRVLTFMMLINLSAFAQAPAQKKVGAPPAVLDAFKKQYPNATIKTVSSETEGGRIVYEIESMDGSQRRDLLYSADGKVISTEELIPNAQLPKAVVDSLASKYPK